MRLGLISRVRQARYATPDAPSDAVAATRIGGMLAGPSAASSYGLWHGFDTRLHVSVGENSSRLRTNVAPSFRRLGQRLTPDLSPRSAVLHWLVDGAVPELGPECWRVTLPVCLRQMVAWCDRETAIACLDTALTEYKLSRTELLGIFSDAPASDRLLAGECCLGSDSGTESLVRQRLAAVGIHVRQQIEISGVGRVDMGISGTRIILEIDSEKYHDNDEAFERDRWRTAELVARGYVVIRLSYRRVTADWNWCLRVILGAMAAA
ncbi:endonuclease domain-containing protein [Parafrigoribacterium mesophilum]|uniref:endonuclease domain-containing protein n=1 Tax=Parafrigoribacterium mesophilum TaxID=433646 RepID=UPI0031FE0515